MRNISELQYNDFLERWKLKYRNDHSANCNGSVSYNYCTSTFINDVLTVRKREIESEIAIKQAIDFVNKQYGLYDFTRLDLLKTFCFDNQLELYEVVEKYSEYRSISDVWSELILTYEEPEAINSKGKTISMKESNFQLDSSVLSRVDFIRLINTLWELKAFRKNDGQIPSKKETMIFFGKSVGLDLEEYQKDLSKALSNPKIESNLAFFDVLSKKMTDIYSAKGEKS